jgi:hypothetical protein
MSGTKIVVEYRNRAIYNVKVSSDEHITCYGVSFNPLIVYTHSEDRFHRNYPSLRDVYNNAGYYERESLNELLAVVPQLAHENGFVFDFNVRAWVQGNPAPHVIIV